MHIINFKTKYKMNQIFNKLFLITFIYLTCSTRWILSVSPVALTPTHNSSRIQSNSEPPTGIGTDVSKNIISTREIKVRIF